MVRALPDCDMRVGGRRAFADLLDGLLLTIGQTTDRDQSTRIAAVPARVSRSIAAGRYAVLASRAGRVGVDIETIARIKLNATIHDRWLTTSERALVEGAADPATELACHWVLKEAYGKALGVGLALPLDQLAFRNRDGVVTLEGSAAPPLRHGWSFHLYRHADLLLGIAHQPNVRR